MHTCKALFLAAPSAKVCSRGWEAETCWKHFQKPWTGARRVCAVCKHLLISSNSARNPSVTRELKLWQALWPTGPSSTIWLIVEDKFQIQAKIWMSLVWQLGNHTVPECKNLKLGLCICRRMWDCTNASWFVVWIPALKVNNSEELSNPVRHGGKWVTFSYAKHGKPNENNNYGLVILL